LFFDQANQIARFSNHADREIYFCDNPEGGINKSIQDDYLSNLQALKPIIDQMAHFDMKGILNVPSVYDDTGLTFKDRWGFNNPNFSLIDIFQNWN
jgi:hypothetical protein